MASRTVTLSRLTDIWSRTSQSYWFVPSLMVAAAVLCAIGALWLDVSVAPLRNGILPWFGIMGAEAARRILSTVASTMVTVAGVVFSITIVALQLASSQFGPRVLRNFMNDHANQVVFGTFTGAFVYCLLVLSTVRDDPSGFVPVIAVAAGLFLGIAGIGVMIFFIHHIAQGIRVEQVVATIGEELEGAIARLFPEELGEEPGARAPADRHPPDFERDGRPVPAPASGYVRSIDSAVLLSVAQQRALVLRLLRRPGDFVAAGVALAEAAPAGSLDRAAAARIAAAFALGIDRTPLQDADYVVRQLAQIALRALSPAINDPFTAVECINRLTQGLRHAAGRCRPSACRFDDGGSLRVVAPATRMLPLALAGLAPIGRDGSGNVEIVSRLFEAIGLIAAEARYADDREGLIAFARELKGRSEARLADPRDREQIARAHALLMRRHGPNDGRPRRMAAAAASP